MSEFSSWFVTNIAGITHFDQCGIHGNLGWLGLVLLMLLEAKKIRWIMHHTIQFVRHMSHTHEAETRAKEVA